MTFTGHPEIDPEEENEEMGLHGRLSFLPAKNVVADGNWEGEDYAIRVRGKIREADPKFHQEMRSLKRKVNIERLKGTTPLPCDSAGFRCSNVLSGTRTGVQLMGTNVSSATRAVRGFYSPRS